MTKGLLIVLSGPSGVGKKTLWSSLLNNTKYKLVYSISMTTRPKRVGERDANDYYFVTKAQFKKAIDKNQMLEYATYVNNYYGTPRVFVDKLRQQGKNVLLEIDVNGALQIMKYSQRFQDKGVITIFISPPSLSDLKKRLLKRGTESHEKIVERINQAQWEISKRNQYKYIIINDSIIKARAKLRQILDQEIASSKRNK